MSDEQKRAAALAALRYVEPGSVIGVGSGTTVACFIDALATTTVGAAVASSEQTRRRLEAAGVRVADLEEVGGVLPLYIDGADAIDPELRLVKGAGGAHVREKVLATSAALFVCIADETKLAASLSAAPVPVEVIPMAHAFVRRELEGLGEVVERAGYATDNGNVIFDVHGLDVSRPIALEVVLESLPGAVGCGLFARRPADVALIGYEGGVREVRPASPVPSGTSSY